MVKPVFRTKSISTKVTDEEYSQLEAQAGGRAISEWAREVLLKPAGPSPVEVAVMGEVIALRTILLNVLYKMANGEPVTVEAMQQLISRADADKGQRAVEQLAARAGR